MSNVVVATPYPGRVTVTHKGNNLSLSATRRTKLGGWDTPGWVIDTDYTARNYGTKADAVTAMTLRLDANAG